MRRPDDGFKPHKRYKAYQSEMAINWLEHYARENNVQVQTIKNSREKRIGWRGLKVDGYTEDGKVLGKLIFINK